MATKVIYYDEERRRLGERVFPSETPQTGDIVLFQGYGFVVKSRTWMESEPSILLVLK